MYNLFYWKYSPQYKVVKRIAAQFGRQAYVFVIAKKTWLGFYWDTDEYYFTEESAQKRCNKLNGA